MRTDADAATFLPFNRPAITGYEQAYLDQVMARGKLAAGGPFSTRCNAWLEEHFGAPGALTTTSCTHALEMAAMLSGVQPGDEVILPSFAFSSTATAFARCGASLVFVDIEPATMNIDPAAVAAAITPRTRVIVALHYAGVACDMDVLARLAGQHGLIIVEDAAQAIFSSFRRQACGTFGAFGCLSFHETKNIHCGEGGALVINDPDLVARAEIIWEKGTDRARFFRGEVDKYTWQDLGSSYVLGELCSAFLLAQMEHGEAITRDRLRSWQEYRQALAPLAEQGLIELPVIPDSCQHNGHIFWLKTRDQEEQARLISFLKQRSIHSVFHYVPLHSSPAGRRYGRFAGSDRYTSREAARLVRLPLFYGFDQAASVAGAVCAFYRS
jgi:dTDP-4-amino-4,6-dideoxygalactose transaminase